MEHINYQKGKFYTLPIVDIRREDINIYFIVEANGRQYPIRMFDEQRRNISQLEKLTELPCMVKDVHGDNIIFVQNFAQMFWDHYNVDRDFQFMVSRFVGLLPDGQKYYDVLDTEVGLPFRLKIAADQYLQPYQKISCRVLRPYPNKLVLKLSGVRKQTKKDIITPEALLSAAGISGSKLSYFLTIFKNAPLFEEARAYLERQDPQWVIKAIMAVPKIHLWSNMRPELLMTIVEDFRRVCLYVLEESDFLQQFKDTSDLENFQEWIAKKIEELEISLECLMLLKERRCGQEIDNILRKIGNSGYIYDPSRKMNLLIDIFSMNPAILEDRIDKILDLIGTSARNWKVASFRKAFAGFMEFYILSNRDSVNRCASVDDPHAKLMLERMIKAITFLLLLTNSSSIDLPLYKSMLYHYLSFVRFRNVMGKQQGASESDTLVEHAFRALVTDQTRGAEVNWDATNRGLEVFAQRMATTPWVNTTFTNRSYETDKLRFTVSTEGITLASAQALGSERNVLPANLLDWHNIQIYLDNPSKYAIGRNSKIPAWKKWWAKVEKALQSPPETKLVYRPRKVYPEIGAEVTVRVLSQCPDNPYRFYCRIEDEIYKGEGYLDSYIKGGSTALFHYDPSFTLDSFMADGKPLLFKVKVNSNGNPNDEEPMYMFNAMNGMDNFVGENVQFGHETDCKLIYHDLSNQVFLGITSEGFGVFVPDWNSEISYNIEDTVLIRLTDCSNSKSIQAEVIGMAEDEVDVRTAAENLLFSYANEEVYEESADELAEEAMSVAEDDFNKTYISQIISILDHKALMESDNVKSYGYLSLARILAQMIEDEKNIRYLAQRQELLELLDYYGTNGSIDEERLNSLENDNEDIIDLSNTLKEGVIQLRMVHSLGKQENNTYLWDICSRYSIKSELGKIARLALSYNLAEGFDQETYRENVLSQIKNLLKLRIVLPKVYSFGQEGTFKEFKTSIVYPPENGMRPDLKTQTYNILRVICGMANAYGGTLYLGVSDYGTARGLANDLAFFQNSKDKFDNYVRNQIKMYLGHGVNASIKIEHPEAGDHWIYAINVNPSKTPVKLLLDNSYWNREGSATFLVSSEEEMAELMAQRDFKRFEADASTLVDTDIAHDEADSTARAAKVRQVKEDDEKKRRISTSSLRNNVVDNWRDNYGVDTCGYIRFHTPGTWSRLDDVQWEDGLLTLAINNDEKDGALLIVYEDGSVLKVPVDQMLKRPTDQHHKCFSDKKPVFISPARKSDALLSIYEDGAGRHLYRLDDIANIPDSRVNEQATPLVDVEVPRVVGCEIIPSAYHADLKRMHNQKRTTLGFQISGSYGQIENEILSKLGIKL
ncbi:MAG: ATP-binding protein [Muribaculaceae bacterium]|nr:ATP-binding protein [Muribaculaceae bacterium]